MEQINRHTSRSLNRFDPFAARTPANTWLTKTPISLQLGSADTLSPGNQEPGAMIGLLASYFKNLKFDSTP